MVELDRSCGGGAAGVERRRQVLFSFHRHDNLREAEKQVRGLARNVIEAGLADRNGGREHVVAHDPLAIEKHGNAFAKLAEN